MSRDTFIKFIKKYSVYFSFAVMLIVLVISLCCHAAAKTGERKVFYYYSADTKSVAAEVRYMNSKPVQGKVQLFVDDLILGPMTNRYKPLFARGTKVDFCMQQGRTLYVGLSSEALKVNSETVDLRTGVNLLRVNIVKNFTKINTVKVYIDGKSVWDESES